MKWISFIEVKNFKIHKKKTRVDFTPGLNVIVGESDIGKSTFIKAAIKCLFNKPDRKGEDFLTWGAKRGSKVHIWVGIKDDDDGQLDKEEAPETIIERVLGKGSVNEYHIYYPGEEEPVSFTGFGKTVPPEVMAVHGMREVDMGYGKEQLNYMGQFDGFFLLGRRPEDVAQAIGRLAHTDVIDKVRDGLRSDIASNVRKLGETDKDLSGKVLKLKEFEYLDDEKESLEALRDLREAIADVEEEKAKVITLGKKTKREVERYEHILEKLGAEVDFELALSLLSVGEMMIERSSAIERIEDKVDVKSDALLSAQGRIESAPDVQAAYESMESAEGSLGASEDVYDLAKRIARRADSLKKHAEKVKKAPDFTAVDALAKEAEEKVSFAKGVHHLSTLIERNAQAIAKKILLEREKEASLEKSMEALEGAMEGRCPICGSDISDHDISEITSHIT